MTIQGQNKSSDIDITWGTSLWNITFLQQHQTLACQSDFGVQQDTKPSDIGVTIKHFHELQTLPSNIICNIFELVFTLCHKCNKYNCLPWKMLNNAGNSYITRLKQLCHQPDTLCHTGDSYITLSFICSAY